MRWGFIVEGPPVGKERARTVKRAGKVHSFTPIKTRHYEERVRLTAKVALGRRWDRKGRFAVCIEAYHSSNVFPDIDNVAKAILDGMHGVAFDNDKQVWMLHVERNVGSPPRVEVSIWRDE